MSMRMRTKDGHTVGEGDYVWAVNGTGPYRIVDVAAHGGDLVYLERVGDDTDGLYFAPGDLELYICRNRPKPY